MNQSPNPESPPNPRDKRPEFLIEVYRQMMSDINRHIVVVWQSIGVVVGSFAILGLVEKQILSLDFAASLFIIICTWSVALLIDSSYWYNRNLCIIANIEKLFFLETDKFNVHYYFVSHRPNNKMITTLVIQVVLAIAIAFLVLIYHFIVRVIPGFLQPLSQFDPPKALPYAATIAAIVLLILLHKKRRDDYQEFIDNSPGIAVSPDGITLGGGHGFRKKKTTRQNVK